MFTETTIGLIAAYLDIIEIWNLSSTSKSLNQTSTFVSDIHCEIINEHLAQKISTQFRRIQSISIRNFSEQICDNTLNYFNGQLTCLSLKSISSDLSSYSTSFKLVSLQLSDIAISRGTLIAFLKDCCNLKTLELKSVLTEDNNCINEALPNLSKLEELSLRGIFLMTSLDNVSNCTNLLRLCLENCPQLSRLLPLVFRGTVPIALQYVNMSGTSIDSHDLNELFDQCKSIRVFLGKNCRRLQSGLVIRTERLQHLDLTGCTRLKKMLLRCPILKFVSLNHCAALETLDLKCYILNRLDLTLLSNLTLVTLVCPGLERLEFSGCVSICSCVSEERSACSRDISPDYLPCISFINDVCERCPLLSREVLRAHNLKM